MPPKYYPAGFDMPFSCFQGPRVKDIHAATTESSQTQGSTYHQKEPKDVGSSLAPTGNKGYSTKWPPADILEYNDKYVVEVEIPGFQRKGIAIDFEDYSRTLTIKGHGQLIKKMIPRETHLPPGKKQVTILPTSPSTSLSNNPPTKVLRERRTERNFQSAFVIEERIHADKISASMSDGILTITIPKSAEAKRHHIPILPVTPGRCNHFAPKNTSKL